MSALDIHRPDPLRFKVHGGYIFVESYLQAGLNHQSLAYRSLLTTVHNAINYKT